MCATAECQKSKVFNEKFKWNFQLSLKTFDFLNSTTEHFYRSIIKWSLNRSSVIIFDNLFPLSLHGRCLSSLDRQDLLVPQSRTTIIAQHRAYASVKVEPDITRHCFWSFVNFIIWFRRQVTILFPIFKCLWQKLGQRAILSPTGFLWLYRLRRSYSWLAVTENYDLSYQRWI